MTKEDPSAATTEEADATCPYCGSTETKRDHPKGPSLCRSMYFCESCQQPFERFS
ncbi:1,2-phenylacetyl-CoA epoxidase subunit PaaE [Natrinema salinisoli]|uniref:1,2-phenylacetyl-CoA epoxidase subunit PaaE n=1 Tax=Natrinema salinisoli TaxID=2878535 RepID=UPI001CF0BA4C|nr:1,2-phenylacetyl-CoA epoxidase subunit PaaE [Natrinema salinisoli]